MRHWPIIVALAAGVGLLIGCKDVVNPHAAPQGDPSRLVASMAAVTNQALRSSSAEQITLTLNNAPEANEPLEQDFVTELVELFEKRNPNIRIQYSPWQYSSDSFFERHNNRTLTDIIEVEAEHMVPIIEANAAANLTEDVKYSPEIQIMNPDVFTVTSKDGKTYGVPVELHTLALFYNRRLLSDSKIVVPQASQDKVKGKGDEGVPRENILSDLPPPMKHSPVTVAQSQSSYYYPPGYQAPQRNSQQRQPAQQRSGQQRTRQQQYNEQYQQYYQQQQQYYQQYQQQYNQYYQQYYQQNPQQNQQQEDARARRMQSRKKRDEPTTGTTESTDDTSGVTVSDDTLTSEAELALLEQQTSASDAVTTVIRTEGLPQDMAQFIRLAVRLTDHKKGVAGYGPVLFASEGGREYSQWAIQSGVNMQSISNQSVTLDVDKSGEVAQFMKDLHWRFDVTPMPDKCYYDNLMNQFVNGKLGMMLMPADGQTVGELIKRGMKLEDIGIAALPAGMSNRKHLTYGKCLIVNSQLDKAHRTAAFKWLMFMASPEVHRMRAQFFHREREMTGAPSVPLYSASMQQEFYDSIRQYRSLPLWADYESFVATNLQLEPSFQTDRFYEAIAEGLRPVIERKDSDPFQSVRTMTSAFESKYIVGEKPTDMLDLLVEYIKDKNTQ